VGWQSQINGVSVQQTIERALSKLTGLPAPITGASRTDAGVHALGQVAHFDIDSSIPDEKFPLALNTKLPPDIRAINAQTVAPTFHARFHARRKRYRYEIHNSRCAPVLERSHRWHVPVPLDIDAMREEARYMIGEHDFAAFAASGSAVKQTVRTVFDAEVNGSNYDPALIELWISGDGFLYNMVRIFAGTLVDASLGKLGPGAVRRAIRARDRLLLGQTAPAHGLTLMNIEYDRGDEENAATV
jgi:tRNA pseudouridine38-40 synthase